nr:PREDICTED: globoside alpha-1,3-N-acetylgalactosaminyltransferase 1-like [Latimeria chalumnae]|eukprot:XP_014340834.1 PREDICTED: globoside alpha-1,3-N-acetylgalactosaminyltransferase 1-like [Latimeria chalumnae]
MCPVFLVELKMTPGRQYLCLTVACVMAGLLVGFWYSHPILKLTKLQSKVREPLKDGQELLPKKQIPPLPELIYPQPKVFEPSRRDVLTVTPWLAPIIWEGTFNYELLEKTYKPLNLTIGATAFAIGK